MAPMSTIVRASVALILCLVASASLAQPPYRVGGSVTRPEKISGDPPQYTEMARKARIMGVVIVEVVIDEEGNVTQPRVLKGLPMGLDKAAVDAVQTWKFKPSTLDGKPVPVYYILTVNFHLDSDFSFGPRFSQLLNADAELGDLVRSQRYQEALDLLDGRPESQEMSLARSYVLLGLDRDLDAWKVAQSLESPEAELLSSIGQKLRNRAKQTDDETERKELLDEAERADRRAAEVRSKPGPKG